ncbi:hypothetical protein [Deinococcus sp. Leaf326]|uniref:hypothetical protein n=1 Tax=Deinococcus sp. Leaf326 TaxID=1736338 RepID=UPI0006F22655|nr:hypothetical protein [Deinococcus sp. Leaf326]KQR08831.1 hypothetical protein ASF71_09990 [Deinococcus sp. Leaf326]
MDLSGLDKSIFEALEIILGKSLKADAALLEQNLDFILSNLDNAELLKEFFSKDAADLKDALTKRKRPKSISAKRYLVVREALVGVIEALYAGEVQRVLEQAERAKLTPKQRQSLLTASQFMNPDITKRFLTDALRTKHQEVALSERIWDFTQLPKETLLDLVRTGVAEGKNPQVIKSIIRKQLLDQSEYNVRRLVVTESRRLWQEVQTEAYSEFKHIKYVRLKLSPKHKVKDICDEWVSKGLIPFEEAPKMPLHPNSRSILQAVPTPTEEWKKDMGIS